MGIDAIIGRNRRFQLLVEEKMRGVAQTPLLAAVKAYIDAYVGHNDLDENTVWTSYERFLTRYLSDIQQFLATGGYPSPSPAPVRFSRIEYDLALMLSVVCAYHRYRIMELLVERAGLGQGLVIGCGSGLELELIKGRHRGLTAYDLALNPFCRRAHPTVSFHEREFRDDPARYDAVYLIELLEHLEQPFELLAKAARNLAPGGRILLTTASNVPQFDHRFNFEGVDFRGRVAELGLAVEFGERIPHGGKKPALRASNDFYVLTRAQPRAA